MRLYRDLPRMTPIMSGCGMADLMCKDCSYKAFQPSQKHRQSVTYWVITKYQKLASTSHKYNRRCLSLIQDRVMLTLINKVRK